MKSGIYKHYKGGLYKVFFVGKHSETLEEMVCYEQLSSNTFWVRPRQMFEESIELEGKSIPRFTFVKNS